MIRSYFGLSADPFALRDVKLLSNQQEIHDTLRVHSQQGGLCLVVGRPGTGKSVIKESLTALPEKEYLIATVAQTLHTYFPKNHNLILVGQVELLASLDLAVNQDIKSRVTYSVITRRLSDDAMRGFIELQLDRIGLAHQTFTTGALELIIRTADGVLRRCRNLCLACMLEAVRASSGTTIDIDLVNRVLMQPHWQKEVDLTDF